MADWLQPSGADVILRLHIQPAAKQTGIAGLHGDALKIRLAAPPVDGKANEALIAFLATKLGCSKSALEIIGGQTSRAKRVRVRGLTPEAVRAGLGK